MEIFYEEKLYIKPKEDMLMPWIAPLMIAMYKMRLEIQASIGDDDDLMGIWLAVQWFGCTLFLYLVTWYAYVSSHILGSVILGLCATASLFLEIFMLVSYAKEQKKETREAKFPNTPIKPTKFGDDYW